MRQDLDHLPQRQQDELRRATKILMDEFSQAISRATQPWKRDGKVLKVILFGSYARDDWVDEPENGYQSDFDLLIVVNHDDLTDIADYWYVAEDRILRDDAIGRQVNIIVHSLSQVNDALRRGAYFWTDIARDGILLHELPNHRLASPMPPTAVDALNAAKGYYEQHCASAANWYRMAQVALIQEPPEQDWLNKAAFNLHQATETAYACFLLTTTFYFPRSHNIKFLRSIAEDKEPRLIGAWPRSSKGERRRFELLKRAYVEARYSANYEIGGEDVEALAKSVQTLREVVETVCRERLAQLKIDVESAN